MEPKALEVQVVPLLSRPPNFVWEWLQLAATAVRCDVECTGELAGRSLQGQRRPKRHEAANDKTAGKSDHGYQQPPIRPSRTSAGGGSSRRARGQVAPLVEEVKWVPEMCEHDANTLNTHEGAASRLTRGQRQFEQQRLQRQPPGLSLHLLEQPPPGLSLHLREQPTYSSEDERTRVSSTMPRRQRRKSEQRGESSAITVREEAIGECRTERIPRGVVAQCAPGWYGTVAVKRATSSNFPCETPRLLCLGSVARHFQTCPASLPVVHLRKCSDGSVRMIEGCRAVGAACLQFKQWNFASDLKSPMLRVSFLNFACAQRAKEWSPRNGDSGESD